MKGLLFMIILVLVYVRIRTANVPDYAYAYEENDEMESQESKEMESQESKEMESKESKENADISLMDRPLRQRDTVVEWQVDKTLLEALKYLFLYKVGADVSFIVRDTEGPSQGIPITFQAHRTLIRARSSILADLIQKHDEEVATSSLTEKKAVAINGVDPETFRQMLHYIYTDAADITSDNVLYVAGAALRFRLTGLQRLCGDFVEKDLSETTVWGIIKQANHFKDEQLMNKCLDVIALHASTVFSSPAFLKIHHDILIHLVANLRTINAYELDVFVACVDWARAHCRDCNIEKLSALLNDIIQHIHFPSMSLAQFTNEVVATGLLSAQHVAMIYQEIVSPNSTTSTIHTAISASFPTDNRGKPVHFPATVVFQELPPTTNIQRLNYYTFQCFVRADVTLKKVFTFKLINAAVSYIKIKLAKESDYQHYCQPVSDNSDHYLKSCSFGLNIKQGIFSMRIEVSRHYSMSYYDKSSIKPEFPDQWQKREDVGVEWWCESEGSPLHALSFQTQNKN